LTGWQTKEQCYYNIGAPGYRASFCDKLTYYINGDGWVWIDSVTYRWIDGNAQVWLRNTCFSHQSGQTPFACYSLFDQALKGQVISIYPHQWLWFGSDTQGWKRTSILVDVGDFTPAEMMEGYYFPLQ
jgi:hypothetical protein